MTRQKRDISITTHEPPVDGVREHPLPVGPLLENASFSNKPSFFLSLQIKVALLPVGKLTFEDQNKRVR